MTPIDLLLTGLTLAVVVSLAVLARLVYGLSQVAVVAEATLTKIDRLSPLVEAVLTNVDKELITMSQVTTRLDRALAVEEQITASARLEASAPAEDPDPEFVN